MTANSIEPTIVLIAGHWLGAWAWDDVVEHLRAAGRRAVAMTLPGLEEADGERESRTLDDQEAAIERVAAREDQPVVIVAHSGANAPVSLMLDRHSELVRRVVWVDSGPVDLSNDARLQIPTTLVCCSMPSSQIMELADAGLPMFAEVANLRHRDLVDLPTGHWPMWSRPEELARLLNDAALSSTS